MGGGQLKELRLRILPQVSSFPAMQCLDDAVEDTWTFLKSMQPGLAAWEPFLLSYIRSVNTILEVHSNFFWPITKKKTSGQMWQPRTWRPCAWAGGMDLPAAQWN